MRNPLDAEETLRAFLEGTDEDGPFIMVNLLKFKPGGGAKQYRKYGEAMSRLIPKIGGKFIYNGRVIKKFVGEKDWHAVALVQYPSRKAFYDMLHSAEYQAIHPFREDGLEKTRVYATLPLTVEQLSQ